MAFVTSPFGHDQILDYYIKDLDRLYFEYVNFITDPAADTEVIKTSLNDHFAFTNTAFFIQSDIVDGSNMAYEDIMTFSPYIMISAIILVLTMIVYRLFDRKKIAGEVIFLKDKYYRKETYLIIKMIFVFILTLVLALGLYPLSGMMNELGNEYGYASIMNYNVLLIIATVAIIDLIAFVSEIIIYGYQAKKSK